MALLDNLKATASQVGKAAKVVGKALALAKPQAEALKKNPPKKSSGLTTAIDLAKGLNSALKPSVVVNDPIQNMVAKSSESIKQKGKEVLNNAIKIQLGMEMRGVVPPTVIDKKTADYINKNIDMDKVRADNEMGLEQGGGPNIAELSPEGDDTKKSYLEKYLGSRGGQKINLNSLTLEGVDSSADAFKQDRIKYGDLKTFSNSMSSLALRDLQNKGVTIPENPEERKKMLIDYFKGSDEFSGLMNEKNIKFSATGGNATDFQNQLATIKTREFQELLTPEQIKTAQRNVIDLWNKSKDEDLKDFGEFASQEAFEEIATGGLGVVFGGVKALNKFGPIKEWPGFIKDMWKSKNKTSVTSKKLLDDIQGGVKETPQVVGKIEDTGKVPIPELQKTEEVIPSAKKLPPSVQIDKQAPDYKMIKRKLDTKSMGLEDSPSAAAYESYKAPQIHVSQGEIKLAVNGKQYTSKDIIDLAQNIWDNPKSATVSLETQEVVRNTYHASLKEMDELTKKLALDPDNEDLVKQFTELNATNYELSNAVKLVKGVAARNLSLQKTVPGQILKDDLFLKESQELLSTLPKEASNGIFSILQKATLNPKDVLKDKKFLSRADEIIATLPEEKATQVRTLLEKARMGAEQSTTFIKDENFRKATAMVLKNLPKEKALELNGKLLRAKGDPDKIQEIINQATKTTWRGKMEEYMMAAMLSNPKTHLKNIMGTMINVAAKLARMPIEATVDLARHVTTGAERQVFFGELPAALKSMVKSTPSAVMEAGRDFKKMAKGGVIQQVKEGEIGNAPQIKGTLGNIIRTPLNLLAVEDKFFKKIVRDLETSRYEVKANKGVRMSSGEVEKTIDKETLESLFQGELGTVGKAMQNLANSNPALKVVFPFIKTPLNIVKEGLKHTPLGFLNAFTKRGADFPKEMSKAILGTAMSIPVYNYAMGTSEDGLPNITGAAPLNEAERDAFYRAGLMPYSIRVGDHYVSYKDMEPFSSTLSLSAKAAEEYKKNGEINTDFLMSMSSELVRNIGDKSAMKSFGQLLDGVFMENELNPGEKLIGAVTSKVGQFIPNVIGGFGRGVDEDVREPTGAKETLQAIIPFWNQQLSAKTDLFGNEMKKKNGFLGQTIMPFTISKDELNVMDQELMRLKTPVGPPSRTVMGVELNKKAFNEMKILRGQTLQKTLWDAMQSPVWEKLNDNQRSKFIKDTESAVDKSSSMLYFINNKESLQKSFEGSKKSQINLFKEMVPLLEPEYRSYSDGQLDEFVKTNLETLNQNFQQRLDDGLLAQDLLIASQINLQDYAK